MISNKHINKIILVVLVIAIVFTSYFTVVQRNVTASVKEAPEYIEKAFDKDKITSIDIEISQENWQSILDNPTAEEYVPANIIINGEKFNNVGLRAKGNSSLSSIAIDDTTDRYSFKIKFDEYIKGQTYYGLDKLVLNNNYSDTTNMKEYLSYNLLTEMGIATPAFAFSKVMMNGEYFGLYLGVEAIEESFIERNYGSAEGNLYKPEGMNMMGNAGDGKGGMPEMNGEMPNFPGMPQGEGNNGEMPNFPGMPQGEGENGEMPNFPGMQEGQGNNGQMPNIPGMQEGQGNNGGMPQGEGNNGGMSAGGTNLVWTDDNLSSYSNVVDSAVFKTTDNKDKEKVVEMIKNLNAGTNLEEYLNVDEILRYFAVNTFLVNLDSYASNMKHNYYLYERDGIFEILPWDYNMSFADFQFVDAASAINFPIDSPVTDSLENSPLIGKLLEVDEYKETYHKYLEELVQYVNNGTFANTVSKTEALISEYVKSDPTAFYTYDEFKTSLPELITFAEDRSKSIAAQLDGSQPSETYGNIETKVNLNALGSMGGGGLKNNMQDPLNPEGKNQTSNADNNKPLGNPGMLGQNEALQHMNLATEKSSIKNNLPTIILYGVSILSLILVMIFLARYNKRKYFSK